MPLKNDQQGNALMEFVFVFPLLLIILFGVIQIGLLMSAKQTLTYASREAVRIGALTNDDDQIQAITQSALSSLDLSKINIDISPSHSTRTISGSARGQELTIGLNYTAELLIPGLTKTITLNSKAVALIECNQEICSSEL